MVLLEGYAAGVMPMTEEEERDGRGEGGECSPPDSSSDLLYTF